MLILVCLLHVCSSECLTSKKIDGKCISYGKECEKNEANPDCIYISKKELEDFTNLNE